MSTLAEVARESDRAVADARAALIRAVREASAQGMTQLQIAREIGRSQPEVSRLLRFHGTTPLARRVRAHRQEILAIIGAAGGRDVRVFGSLAEGLDGPDSDVDLVFTMHDVLSLMDLARLERDLRGVVGADVDLVPESSIRPGIRERVLREAVPL
jgi:predicted nucleotidyltransferase